uniref:Zinc fingers and homeoboxes protein 1-like isoform X1 n=2 Tax=Petromyzon marinus TaxID=7757 RepID=A0AAJ7U979_PETMA|nr:zinc fingers and homeoboxes protein 1-like isoform X1 [Petromyzon marinus]XP_032830583.1 zinc fingers and homeoboxes protein 1-like isoform X1 [Petromyzon marinus]
MAGFVASEEDEAAMKMGSRRKSPHSVILIDDTDVDDVEITGATFKSPEARSRDRKNADWELAKNIKEDPLVQNDVRITYVCKHCSFRAQGLPAFTDHLKRAHPTAVPNPIYVCRQCKFRTPSYESFMEHNAASHPTRVRTEKEPEVPKQMTAAEVCKKGENSSAKCVAVNVLAQNKETSAQFLPLDGGMISGNSSDDEVENHRGKQVGKNEPRKASDVPRASNALEVTNRSSAHRAHLVDNKISTPNIKAVNDTSTPNTRLMNMATPTSPANVVNHAVLLNAHVLSSKIIAQNNMNVEPLRTTIGANTIPIQNELKITTYKKIAPKRPDVEPLFNIKQKYQGYPPPQSSKANPTLNGGKEPLKKISDNFLDVHTTSSVDEDLDKTSSLSDECALTISIPSNSIPSYNPAMDLNPYLINSLRKFPYPLRTEICYLAVVTGHTELEVAMWFMAQRLLNGISWTPEEVERIKRKSFVTNCLRTTGRVQSDSGFASENSSTPNGRETGDDNRPATEDKLSSSSQTKTTVVVPTPQPVIDTLTVNKKRKAEENLPQSVTNGKKSKRKTHEQLTLLREFFMKNEYPSKQDCQELAKKTNLTPSQVIKWFQHQRTDSQNSVDLPVNIADIKLEQSENKTAKEAALPQVLRDGDQTHSRSENVRTASTYLRNYYINMFPDFTPPKFKEKTEVQLAVLDSSFEQWPWLLEDELERLHTETKLTRREIEAWFNDQRQQRGIPKDNVAVAELAESRHLKVERTENVPHNSSMEKLNPSGPLEPDKGSIEVVLENDNSSDDLEEDCGDDNDGYDQEDSEDGSTMSLKTVKLPQGQLNQAPMLGNLEARTADTTQGQRRFKTKYQLEVLSASFSLDPKPSKEEVKRLVEVTNLRQQEIVLFFKRKLKAKRRSEKRNKSSSANGKITITTKKDTESKKTNDSPGHAKKSKTLSPPLSTKKTKSQLNILKSVFVRTQWPTNEEYTQMVEMTKLSRTVIVGWFGDMRYGFKHNHLRWMRDFDTMKNDNGLSKRSTSSEEVNKSHSDPLETTSSSSKSNLDEKMIVDEENDEKDQQTEDEDEKTTDFNYKEDFFNFKEAKAARRGERGDGYAASDVTDNSDNWGEGNVSEEEGHSDDKCSNVDYLEVKSDQATGDGGKNWP